MAERGEPRRLGSPVSDHEVTAASEVTACQDSALDMLRPGGDSAAQRAIAAIAIVRQRASLARENSRREEHQESFFLEALRKTTGQPPANQEYTQSPAGVTPPPGEATILPLGQESATNLNLSLMTAAKGYYQILDKMQTFPPAIQAHWRGLA